MKIIESVKLTNHRRKCHKKINKQLFGYGLCVNNLSIELVILCKKTVTLNLLLSLKDFVETSIVSMFEMFNTKRKNQTGDIPRKFFFLISMSTTFMPCALQQWVCLEFQTRIPQNVCAGFSSRIFVCLQLSPGK